MDSMRRNAQKMMPHIMAMNKDPNVGMKNNRQPKPGVSNLTAYAKGGKVEDKKQDRAMMERHNTLMHPGQKSKLKSGGKVQKYAEGGGVSRLFSKDLGKAYSGKGAEENKSGISRLFSKDLGKAYSGEKPDKAKKETETKKALGDEFKRLGSERAERETKTKLKETFDQLGGERAKRAEAPAAKQSSSFGEAFKAARKEQGAGGTFTWNGKKYSTNRADDAPRSDESFVKRAQQKNKETAPPGDYKPSGYKKGGKVKGDKKKVMGTVGEAKALMNAMKKVRRPATPMPGAAPGLGMAPQMPPRMAPPMKCGGKVMKRAAGGAAKLRKKSPMPNKIKMLSYPKGG